MLDSSDLNETFSRRHKMLTWKKKVQDITVNNSIGQDRIVVQPTISEAARSESGTILYQTATVC